MELSSIQHITPENLSDFQPDLFIATLNHESRCTTIARQMEGISCRKMVLHKQDQIKEYAYQSNLHYFQDNGYEIIEVIGDTPETDALFMGRQSEDIKITLDCTSIPQQWYYHIFSWFANDNHLNTARLRLVYTMAGYVEEGTPPKVKKTRAFIKPKANAKKLKSVLILGLGQEPNVSKMICKILKPDLLYLFYADPPVEKQFVEKLFVNNHDIIDSTPIRNLISYPVHNGQTIYQSLVNVVLPLRSAYTVTIISLGPKIFSIASMLLHMGYPDITISYPEFKRARLLDRVPRGKPVILDALFEGDE